MVTFKFQPLPRRHLSSRHLFKLIKDIRITAGLDQAEGKPP